MCKCELIFRAAPELELEQTMTTILIIVVLFLLLGGGGYYGFRGRR